MTNSSDVMRRCGRLTGLAPVVNSIANSTTRGGGMIGGFFANTSGNSQTVGISLVSITGVVMTIPLAGVAPFC